MFEGRAEEAMNFYVATIPGTEITSIKRYGPGEDGVEGSVMQGAFSIGTQLFSCFDSSVHHAFSFTPAISVFLTCSSADEVDRIYGKLSEGGNVMMGLSSYPFSARFAWLADKFGVSWQLSYPG
jgi:predicted 3-demethylubiquinone-9 3-methyltransferase (glyoxalase superfamily)